MGLKVGLFWLLTCVFNNIETRKWVNNLFFVSGAPFEPSLPITPCVFERYAKIGGAFSLPHPFPPRPSISYFRLPFSIAPAPNFQRRRSKVESQTGVPPSEFTIHYSEFLTSPVSSLSYLRARVKRETPRPLSDFSPLPLVRPRLASLRGGRSAVRRSDRSQ